MMKSGFSKIILVIGAVIAVIGLILMLVGFASAGFKFGKLYNFDYVQKNATISVDGIEKVDIDLKISAVDIKFDPSIEDITIEYTELIGKNGENVTEMQIDNSNGTFKVAELHDFVLGIIPIHEEVGATVRVPLNYLKSLSVDVESGDITIAGNIKCDHISFTAVNGEVNLASAIVECNYLGGTTTNGAIVLGNVVSEEINLTTTNGEVETLFDVVSTTFNVTTVNGKIFTTNSVLNCEDIDLTTVNGEIEVTLFGSNSLYSKDISTVNGKTNVETETSGERMINATTVNGDITILFADGN